MFCRHCGKEVKEGFRYCEHCGKSIDETNANEKEKAEQNLLDSKNVKFGKKEVKKATKKKKRNDKKKEKRTQKKEKWNEMNIWKKIFNVFSKILGILLILVILTAGIVGVFLKLGFIQIPFGQQVEDSLEPEESYDNQFNQLTGEFTDILVLDEESAIEAAKEAGKLLGFENATDELDIINKNLVGDTTYYRLQQYYNGYPVYGRTAVVVAEDSGVTNAFTTNITDVKEISFTSVISQEQVEEAVKIYLNEQYQIKKLEYIDVEQITTDNLYIYTFDTNSEAYLVYCISVMTDYGIFDMTISAENAQIIQCDNRTSALQQEFTYFGQKSLQTFVAESDGVKNQMKYISSTGTQITVLVPIASHKYDWYYDGNGAVVTWDNEIAPDETAVDAMANVIKVYEYYKQIDRDSFDALGGDINVYVHTNGYRSYENKDINQSNNAFFWYSLNGPVMAFHNCYNEDGTIAVNYASELDVMGHEYTHGVIHYTAQLMDTKTNVMPGAINEGVSDVMGYIIEASYNTDNQQIDWTSSVRTSIKGNNTDENQLYNYNDYDNTECHQASTIISYAAYLMDNGVYGKYMPLTLEELSDLWYQTILTLPSNCTFNLLREHVELVAQEILMLDTEKVDCIKAAFDEVGVSGIKEEINTYATETYVSVYGYNGEKHDDYVISIEGKKNIALWGAINEEYSDEIKVNTSEPVLVKLPKGIYTLTVSDGTNSYSETFNVKKNSENTELNFVTNFGYGRSRQWTVTPDSLIYVYNKEKELANNYQVTVSFLDLESMPQGSNVSAPKKDTVIHTVTDNNPFELSLSAGIYEIIISSDSSEEQYTYYALVSEEGDSEHFVYTVFEASSTVDEKSTSSNLSRINYYASDGKLIYYDSYAYYDNGLLCSTTLHSVDYFEDGTSYADAVYTILYLYDEKGNLEETVLDALTISEWYDETTGEIILDYDYDKSGNSIKKSIYPSKESIEQEKFHVDASKTEKIYGNAPVISTDSRSGWTSIYLQNIFEDDEPTDMTTGRFIYVDNNMIPELWMDYGYGYAGSEVFTANNDTIESITFSHGVANCIEKDNLLLVTGGHMDTYYDLLYKIENGEFITISKGDYGAIDNSDIQYDENGEPLYEYYWDDIKVTQSEYKQMLTNTFDESQAADINQNVYTYEQCKMLLQNIVNTVSQSVTEERVKKESEYEIPSDAEKLNGHNYKFYNIETISTWEEAEAYCEAIGGHLAIISSDEENDFLYQLMVQQGYTSAYFGLTDSISEGTWIWVDKSSGNYTNWHSREPNSENGNEDYGMFYWKYSDGTWNDGDFGNRTNNGGRVFICEWDNEIYN